MTTPTRRAASLLAAGIILGCFLWFAGDGLRAYFTPDDMMNLGIAWQKPLPRLLATSLVFVTGEERAVGSLVYRLLFALFGMHPLPFRLFCTGLLLGNLWLLYRFSLRLSRAPEVAAIACLMGAYHAHLADLYYSTGTLYDLLCFTFYFAAFVWYTGIRERGAWPSARQAAGLAALYLAALGSKEMAVMLPFFMLLYELLYHGWPRLPGRKAWWFPALAAAVSALYLFSKLAGPNRITSNPEYRPHLSLRLFLGNWQHYFHDLFYGSVPFTSAMVAAVWIGFLLVALAALRAGRRHLLFAWCVMLFGALPVIFISPRGFFVLYMTMPGWYLFAATLLVWLAQALVRLTSGISASLQVEPRQAVLFVAVAAVLLPLHRQRKPLGKAWVADAHAAVRSVDQQLKRCCPSMPHGAKVLFLTDPYPVEEWMLTFIFRLHYRDPEIQVDRVKRLPAPPDAAALAGYHRLFTLEGGKLTDVTGRR